MSNFRVAGLEAQAECRQLQEMGELEAAFDQVAADLAGWGLELPVHVKLSRAQLDWEQLAERLVYRLERAGSRPDQVVLELDGPGGLELAAAGFRLGRDSLGAGALTLTDLVETPLACVKLDAALIAGIPAELAFTRLCAGILKLLESLELPSVAQGVASRSQRDYLQRNGCQLAQGRVFGLPLESAEVCDYLKAPLAS